MEFQMIGVNEVNTSLESYESNLLSYVGAFGLPTENILVPIEERKRVIKNLNDVITQLTPEDTSNAVYLSKFLAAAASGLFDAALNYLWDETVLQLRKRVANYDIEYFYDIAVKSPDKRQRLSGVEDLLKIDDSELIQGARDIDMISDIGYRHLDYIKYMRNWASAAHPNQVQITGLQLADWLEICIKEVINLPNSTITIEIGRLLKNIRENPIEDADTQTIELFIGNLTQEKADSLSNGLFGTYVRVETEQSVRDNIKKIFPIVWTRIDEGTKNEFGVKFARFSVNGDVESAARARELLELVNGQAYFPEPIRVTEVDNALNQLSTAHAGMNNFYNEPSFALQLERLVGKVDIPKQLNNKYVMVLVDCFITNGYGACWDAEGIYKKLIGMFSQEQINIAIFSFMNEHISSMLQINICERKYREMIDILKQKNVSPAIGEVIKMIEEFPSLMNMRKDSVIREKMKTYDIIIKSGKS